jgi:hypothetical protein
LRRSCSSSTYSTAARSRLRSVSRVRSSTTVDRTVIAISPFVTGTADGDVGSDATDEDDVLAFFISSSDDEGDDLTGVDGIPIVNVSLLLFDDECFLLPRDDRRSSRLLLSSSSSFSTFFYCFPTSMKALADVICFTFSASVVASNASMLCASSVKPKLANIAASYWFDCCE